MADSMMPASTSEVQKQDNASNIDKEETLECLAPAHMDSPVPSETDSHAKTLENGTDSNNMQLVTDKPVQSQEGSEKKTTGHGDDMVIDLCDSVSEEEGGNGTTDVSDGNADVDSDNESDAENSELKKEKQEAQTNGSSAPTEEEEDKGEEVVQITKESNATDPQDVSTEMPISENDELEANSASFIVPSPSQSVNENMQLSEAELVPEESTAVKRDHSALESPLGMEPAAKKQKNDESVIKSTTNSQEDQTQLSASITQIASEKGENPSSSQLKSSTSVPDPKVDSQPAKSDEQPPAQSTAQPKTQPAASLPSIPDNLPKPAVQSASSPDSKSGMGSSPPKTQSTVVSNKNTSGTSVTSTPSSLSTVSSEVASSAAPAVADLSKSAGSNVISKSVVTDSTKASPAAPVPSASSSTAEAKHAKNLPTLPAADSAPSAIVSSPSSKKDKSPLFDPTFASLVKLDPVEAYSPLPLLSARDIAELESSLQIGERYNNGPDDGWRDDWSGNIQLIDKELVLNRDKLAQNPQTKPITMPFCEYVSKNAKNSDGLRGLSLLLSYVYHMKGTPAMAKSLMAHALQRPAKGADQRLKFITDAIKRISYDPTVLRQDGWTTAKSDSPQGASGGAFLIGRRVIWHRFEAIVIAFVHDDEIGDLWKAMWLEDQETFDLEADELQEAMRKWEKKQRRKEEKALSSKMAKTLSGGSIHKAQGVSTKPTKPPASSRFSANSNFTVEGIEHGIILATSFHQNARIGVVWPARVMHVSEIKALGAQQVSRRSSSKNSIHVVFLAPYWNGHYSFSSKSRTDLFAKNPNAGKDPFSAGPLFEMETVEVSETTIQKYPYDGKSDSLSIDNLRSAFRFLGLPKAAFPRFLDSHRMAVSLKNYARKEISKARGSSENASHATAFAALTDTHTLSVRTAMFPNALLNLPFDHMLSNLPAPTEQVSQFGADDGAGVTESILQLHLVMKAMTPPYCWGEANAEQSEANAMKGAYPSKHTGSLSTPDSHRGLTPINSPDPKFFSAASQANGDNNGEDNGAEWSLTNFASEYLLNHIGRGNDDDAPIATLISLGNELDALLTRLRTDFSAADKLSLSERERKLETFLCRCFAVKGYGEDLLSLNDIPKNVNRKTLTFEWRRACERIFKRATSKFSTTGFGNGVTAVLTDSRCNQHLTATGSFERAVRLPAAIRGAKQAGAGSKEGMKLITKIDDKYMELAEKKILPKAHKASYLKRMKTKIAALPPDAKGAPLTDDSEGEGGEDTMGSRGSYTAAVAGVAAALQAVNMVVGGKCVNVFCAVRPPGHHAGRDLRPMNAISNGFCLLNAAACAALYATSPQSEGGLGLKRVCVIDFDVHHGNGTQDILCSTHDSRFLYVSLHAGGAHINGYDDGGESENDDGLRRSIPGGGRNEGIFPGRCGDTSPHEGVLNIPLGQKVTAQAIGNALVSQVSPAVEAFSPELIILSAGFDAHKHDPLGMGGLSAEDFGSVTDVACQMAFKSCSGRVLSILEGGYGVPCCRMKKDLFLPSNLLSEENTESANAVPKSFAPFKVLELGDDLPTNMEDDVPIPLQQKLDKCHAEGFLECVKEHVSSLARRNCRVSSN